MLNQGSNVSTVLTWVRPDLDKHLELIRNQIEHIAASPIDAGGIKNTRQHLTELKYTFEALVLQGTTAVFEEMINLCGALQHSNSRDRTLACGALMDAIVVVPSYLDRLQAGHHDLPVLLLPVINKLRSAYNANVVSEATLFAPNLDVPLPELENETAVAGQVQSADRKATADGAKEFVPRLRIQYENALLRWLQNQNDTSLLAPLHSVCETLRRRVSRLGLRRMWWIAAEVIGGLLDGFIDNDVHIHRLFARLNLTLKTLAESGEAATNSASIDAISQALLFHIAQSKSGSESLDLLKERFHLQALVPDRDALIRARGAVTGRNRDLYNSLGAAVRDELALVKNALDLELRTGVAESARRGQSQQALNRLKDTLQMMGLIDSAHCVEQLLPTFDPSTMRDQDVHKPNEHEPPRESQLLELAEKLIQVESVVEEQIESLGEPLDLGSEQKLIDLPAHELRRVRTRVLAETVFSVQQVQEQVHQHFDGHEAADFCSPMEHIAGAMELIGESGTAELALQLRNALGNLLRSAKSAALVGSKQLDLLADAVAAFELFLAACRDQQNNRSRFLEILKDRLSQLPIGDMQARVLRQTPATQKRKSDASGADQHAPEASPKTIDAALPDSLEAELRAVFLEEYEVVAAMLEKQVPRWLQQPENSVPMTEIRRGFHSLKGSGRMVGAVELGEFAWRMEDLLNKFLANSIEAPDELAALLRLAIAILPELKLRLLQQPTELQAKAIVAIEEQASRIIRGAVPEWHQLASQLPARLVALLPVSKATAPHPQATEQPVAEGEADDNATLEELMCRELAENLGVLKGLMDNLSMDRNSLTSEAHIRAIHSIAGITALQPLSRETELASALGNLLVAQNLSHKAFGRTAIWAIASGLAHLHACLAIHQGGTGAELAQDEDQQIEQLRALGIEYATAKPADAETHIETAVTAPQQILAKTADLEQPQPPYLPETVDHAADVQSLAAAQTDPVDTEILAIFLDEAVEILARSDTLLNNWRDDLSNLDLAQNLQRELHTFKGGARMSGVSAMGDLSHAMESLLERIAGKLLPASVSAIEALEEGCDRLSTWLDQAGTGSIPQAGEVLKLFEQQVAALIAVPVLPEAHAQTTDYSTATKDELLEIPDVIAAPVEAEPPAETTSREEAKPTPQIRVAAELLDSLVNSAGEVSIFRSRMEQQIKQLRENLKESDDTIARLKEQFRKLELEIETQIRSRYHQQAPAEDEEFDPLELDRFSSIQQLSRGLSESVSDLLNLQELLDGAARKSEALLLQQSRVSTDLQEGLMQTRMVHFGTIAPRLRRIVRTAATETRKKARLQLRMTDGGDQLDRNVLERITAPLEHLLRNAVVHGIETPGARSKRGKPKEGKINITVAAEATEFVIRVEDDGAGMDLDAIRARAIKTGLLDKKADPKPQQLMQFILHSGFTTSKKVTGLAGRGVGMDVVNSEIKQIGGSTEIDSETGKGSRFTIRIPFTLAVMQAIGVVAGDHHYLIPLSSVAGVARMLPADYQQLLQADAPHYSFAGQQFSVLELEPLLGEPSTPLGDDTISILLIKSGDYRAAFQVPQLLGHREVVIKPVGPQISSVPGILGGSITSDGQVVVIIDAGPLIRQALLTGARPAPALENTDILPNQPLALVVDDSITMRKVTARVLQGHDFEVITARDGIDATEQMQELVPDVLLLDVEMPRMDGYSVAEFVRADARLRHIPIIMITSRAGEKHRKRGTKAGANAYLSKPYKESELITQVNALLGREEPEDG